MHPVQRASSLSQALLVVCVLCRPQGIVAVFKRTACHRQRGDTVGKAYWIASYREISDPAKLAAYAKLAGPAIEAGGGRFLARTVAAQAYEDGKLERTVLIEFDSVEQAVAVHDGPA